MSGRNPETWGVLSGILTLIAVAVLGIGLFLSLAAHPYVAAAWALLSTVGTVWLGALQIERRYDDRLRIDTERRRAALDRPERRTVADVLTSCRYERLIGDAERDVIVDALHTHFAAGRITPAELDERLAIALGARTVEALHRAVRDLPNEVTGR